MESEESRPEGDEPRLAELMFATKLNDFRARWFLENSPAELVSRILQACREQGPCSLDHELYDPIMNDPRIAERVNEVLHTALAEDRAAMQAEIESGTLPGGKLRWRPISKPHFIAQKRLKEQGIEWYTMFEMNPAISYN